MNDLKINNASFWNLLFMSGYLTLDSDKYMRIPNQEVYFFFEEIVLNWFGTVNGKNVAVQLL